MSRESLLDEAIAKAKEAEDWQLAEWLRMARGSDKAAKWCTAKIHELEDENARLRSCLADDAENARMIMGENDELRELVRHMGACIQHLDRSCENGGCVLCPYQSVKHGCEFESRMLELGIEVE